MGNGALTRKTSTILEVRLLTVGYRIFILPTYVDTVSSSSYCPIDNPVSGPACFNAISCTSRNSTVAKTKTAGSRTLHQERRIYSIRLMNFPLSLDELDGSTVPCSAFDISVYDEQDDPRAKR